MGIAPVRANAGVPTEGINHTPSIQLSFLFWRRWRIHHRRRVHVSRAASSKPSGPEINDPCKFLSTGIHRNEIILWEPRWKRVPRLDVFKLHVLGEPASLKGALMYLSKRGADAFLRIRRRIKNLPGLMEGNGGRSKMHAGALCCPNYLCIKAFLALRGLISYMNTTQSVTVLPGIASPLVGGLSWKGVRQSSNRKNINSPACVNNDVEWIFFNPRHRK